MYTKVFRQIYDGTLADDWQAMVTFQQLLILADDSGVVDMTIAAIHRTTGIPMDILVHGIAALEAPDAGSRTPDMEGRRISRMDPHRDWGWFLVNFNKYRQLVSRVEKKEADRVRIAEKRSVEKPIENNVVAICRDLSQTVADVAHTDTDTDTEKEKSSPVVPKGDRLMDAVLSAYHSALPNCTHITARNPKRVRRVQTADKLARQICRQVGWAYDTCEFWDAYFGECANDPWLRGDVPHKDNPSWRQNLDTLLAEDRFAGIMDRAISTMRKEQAA